MKRLILVAMAAMLLLPATALAKHGRRDRDHDGLRNRAEHRHGTNPRDADTDDDGISDGDEVDYGFHPRKRDRMGNAGSVKAYDAQTGELVISLLKGGELSALVTDDTHLQCKLEASSTPDDQGDSESEDQGEDDQSDDESDDSESEDQGEDDQSDDEGDDSESDDEGDEGRGRGRHRGRGHHGHHSVKCGTEALVEGALIRNARLDIRDGEAVWRKLKLVG